MSTSVQGGTGPDPRWRVFITSVEREKMGPELSERMRGHLDRLHDRALAAEQETARLTAAARALRSVAADVLDGLGRPMTNPRMLLTNALRETVWLDKVGGSSG